jgi:hypothetical protein
MMENIKAFLKKRKFCIAMLYAIMCTIFLIKMFGVVKNLRTDNDRIFANEVALTAKIDTYKTESGKNAAMITELTMKKAEFEQICSDQLATINDLKLKLKRVQSISTTATNTSVTGVAALIDTVIVRDTIKIDTLKYFKWNDSWNHISGIIDGNKVNCMYNGVDTLTTVATKVPKRFLFFKFGCKYVRIDVVNANPSTKIVYNRTVKLTK